jgi:2-polyprenyl-6-methoxyphenol hydroxylase-like FAD-dependent oxidoreductase
VARRVSSAIDFDVAVVGASIAGCTAARLFAQAGARVALIERRPDPAAYKVVCTHQILPSACSTIGRLGLEPLLHARGAPRTQAEFWSPYGGWFGFPRADPGGWGVTRRTLDPLLRELAAGTPGVELLAGNTVIALSNADHQPARLELQRSNGTTGAVRARLLVGADGRGSTIARLAQAPGRIRPHNRFFYFAYWRGVQPSDNVARGWLLDPDAAASFPNEDGLTVLVTGPHRSRLPEFQHDREGAYASMLAALPDGPDLSEAQRVSKLIGKLEMPNVMRPAGGRGVAFVGDAALATDPLFGVGCTFAFLSAEWLVDETAGALVERRGLDSALARYRRKVAWRLGPHHVTIAEYSSGRKTLPWERAVFRAATTDPVVSLALGEVIARERTPLRLLDPAVLRRLLVRGDRQGHSTAPSRQRDRALPGVSQATARMANRAPLTLPI